MSEGKHEGHPNSKLTQYCPDCGYDLHGLPDNRCPECGRRFDRSALPWVERCEPEPSPLLNLLLVAAVILASIQYTTRLGATNVALQTAWLTVVWALTGFWTYLRLPYLAKHRRQDQLLWILVVCVLALVDRPNVPASFLLGMRLWSGGVAAVVVCVAVASGPRRVLLELASAGAVLLGAGGLLITVLAAFSLLSGNANNGEYDFLGRHYPATREYSIRFAALGLGAGVLGGSLCLGLSRLLRRARS